MTQKAKQLSCWGTVLKISFNLQAILKNTDQRPLIRATSSFHSNSRRHRARGDKGQRAYRTVYETNVIANQTSYPLPLFFPHSRFIFLNFMSLYPILVLFCSFSSMFCQLSFTIPQDEAESQS